MRKARKLLIAALTLALALSLALPAAAAGNGAKSVKITYRAIRVVVDGDCIVPIDATGTRVEPFILNGATYMPLAATANALGLKVTWDGPTKTVGLADGGTVDKGSGTPPASRAVKNVAIYYSGVKIVKDGAPVELMDSNGGAVEPFIFNGTTYLPIGILAKTLGTEVRWDGDTSTVYFGKMAQWLCTKQISRGADGAITDTTECTYDENGNVLTEKISDSDGYSQTSTYTYDKYGNVLMEKTTANDGSGYTEKYTYDEHFNLAADETRYDDGSFSSKYYTYDADGNTLTEKYSGTDGSCTNTYAYDAGGNMLTDTYTDGTDPTQNFVETFTYNKNGNMLTDSTKNADKSWSISAYTYDAGGNMLSEYFSDSSGLKKTTTYTYDKNGSVLTEKCVSSQGKEYSYTETYTYDAKGNVTKYDDRYLDGSWQTNYTVYDARGNVVSLSVNSSSGSYTVKYTYDVYDRLTSETESGDSTYGSGSVSYIYDINGNTAKIKSSDGSSTEYTYAKFFY